MLKNIILGIGFILLIPAVISVLLFIAQLVGIETLESFGRENAWTGWIVPAPFSSASESRAAFSSPLPIYIGLMAIAGSLIISRFTKAE